MMVLSTILVTASLLAPPLSRACPLSQELRVLGGELGGVIQCDSDLGRLPVFVAHNGIPADRVLGLLAKSVHATVSQTANGWRLYRTPADRERCLGLQKNEAENWLCKRLGLWDAEVRSESQRARLRQLRDVISIDAAAERAFRTEVGPAGNRDPGLWVSTFLPSGELLRRVVDRIGIDQLSRIGQDERRYYSNSPTRDEGPIRNCNSDIGRFLVDEQEYLSNPAYESLSEGLGRLGAPRPKDHAPLPSSSQLKLLLIETRTERHLTLRLQVFESGGRLIDEAFLSSELSPYVDSPVRIASRSMRNPKDYWVAVSQDSKWIHDVDQLKRSGSTVTPDSEERWINVQRRSVAVGQLPKLFTHPEDFEPDAFIIKEALTEIARQLPRRAFVCQIPDGLWDYSLACVNGDKIDASALMRMLTERAGCEEIDSSEGVVLRPISPLDSEAHFAMRSILGSGLREFVSAKHVGLQQWSKLLYRLKSGSSSPIAAWYMNVLRLNEPHFHGQADPMVFRLIGSLSSGDWNSLEDHSRLGWSESDVDSDLLRRSVLYEAIPSAKNSATVEDQFTHPVEIYPEGVGASFRGGITFQKQIVASPSRDASQIDPQFLATTPQLAATPLVRAFYMRCDFATAHGTFTSTENVFRKLIETWNGEWRTGVQSEVSVEVMLENGMTLTETFTDIGDVSPKTVPFRELPEQYLSAVYRSIVSRKRPPQFGAPGQRPFGSITP